MENSSGQGKASTVPAEIDRWNWGAFFLNWIWGIGNNTFIALLMFVPLVNMVMPFVLGAKGSAWAWRNKQWDSVEHFRKVQRAWAKWSIVVVVAIVGLFVAMFMTITAAMKSSEAYKLASERLLSNPQAVSVLGEPISTGSPTGNIEVSGPSGYANISFSVEGSSRTGTVYVQAEKDLGQWEITRSLLEVDGSGERISLK